MLIAHPTDGFYRSINKHNTDVILAADWLELSVLLFGASNEGITQPEIVDYLIEEQIYDDQDFCSEFVQSAYGEIRGRIDRYGGDYPIAVDETGRMLCQWPWTQSLALTFCLTLSIAPSYSGYSAWVGGHYEEQGELFEYVTLSAMQFWFAGWDIRRTGWSGGTGVALVDFIDSVADQLIESVHEASYSCVANEEKDLGLDLAAVLPFPDGRAAVPAIFGQCASGRNWSDKLQTPDASRWRDLLTLTHTPLRAFSFPFVLNSRDYETRRSQFKGVLMDRIRLLPSGLDAEWLDDSIADRISRWIVARRDWMLAHYALDEAQV